MIDALNNERENRDRTRKEKQEQEEFKMRLHLATANRKSLSFRPQQKSKFKRTPTGKQRYELSPRREGGELPMEDFDPGHE
jgi:hypothetical protein